MQKHTKALHDSVIRLREICVRLQEEADGGSYTKEQFGADRAAYERDAMRYYSLGNEMNEAASTLRRCYFETRLG